MSNKEWQIQCSLPLQTALTSITMERTLMCVCWPARVSPEKSLSLKPWIVKSSWMTRMRLESKIRSLASATQQMASPSGSSRPEPAILSNRLARRSALIVLHQDSTSIRLTTVRVWNLIFPDQDSIKKVNRHQEEASKDLRLSTSLATRTLSTRWCSTRLSVASRLRDCHRSIIWGRLSRRLDLEHTAT